MGEGSMEQRVAALERALARQRGVSLGLAVGLVGAVGAVAWVAWESPMRPAGGEAAKLASPAASADLRVSHLTLVDDHGESRATLGIDAQGTASLRLLAPDGSPRVALSGATSASTLSLLDDRAVARGALAWQSGEATTDQAGLSLRDRAGAPRADLHVANAGPRLTLTNEVGVPLFGVP